MNANLAKSLRDSAMEIFAKPGCGQDVRDVIEYFYSCLVTHGPVVINVHAAHGNPGDVGPRPLGYYSSSVDARVAARRKGSWGADGRVTDHKAIQIGADVFLLLSDKPIDLDQKRSLGDAQLRQQTIQSLTAEQLRVLGVKP